MAFDGEHSNDDLKSVFETPIGAALKVDRAIPISLTEAMAEAVSYTRANPDHIGTFLSCLSQMLHCYDSPEKCGLLTTQVRASTGRFGAVFDAHMPATLDKR